MKLLFVSSKVERRIAALEKAGKSGKTLAQKATGIIDRLASGEVCNPMDTVESYTKYGEKRIKNCRKYDLGCGYRLVTLQRGETIFIPFLGSHDACQRWMENNSRLKAVPAGKGNTIAMEDGKSSPAHLIDLENMDANEEVDDFLQNLNDRDLRTVFNGLVEGTGKGSR
jgi:hypothetical protein